MPPKSHSYQQDLAPLLAAALDQNRPDSLASYLTGHSDLPGPRMNLALVTAFAGEIARRVTAPDPPVARIEALLDGWAALPLADAPANAPREMLPACAVRSYGQVAVVRPDWWEDEITKLYRAAGDPRWRVREIVATALQAMLAADWARTYAALRTWVAGANPLPVRAAAAAVAEPPLLTGRARGEAALAIQAAAVEWRAERPATARRDEAVRILRQALGYTLSVAVAAAPEAGFPVLARLAASMDPDLQWIVRENLKKTRLHRWPDQLAAIHARHSTD
jgi:hypothetical protein